MPLPTKDHTGKDWGSAKAMLDHYGICATAFLYRVNTLHMSLEEALTTPHRENKSTAIETTDHEGNTFPSIKAMCDHWHIPRTTFFRRRKDGWTMEKCLTTPISHAGKKNKISDGIGNMFTTVDEMCAHYGITKHQYMINIRNNCTVQEALNTIQTETDNAQCKDHLGNEYRSINEMCRAYGITKTTLRSRIELGWTLKEILENPQKIKQSIKCKDHLGNEYTSIKEMLKAYGVSEVTFKHRMSRGRTLKECLSPEALRVVHCEDHLGNKFSMLKNMLLYWNCATGVYHKRIETGASIEDALTRIVVKGEKRPFAKTLDLFIMSQINETMYEVKLNGSNIIMSKSDIFDYYRENCLPESGRSLLL